MSVNGAGLWSESEQWRVVEEFRVGSLWEETPHEELAYSRVNSVILGPNGQIYVMEYATDRVIVFSGDGEFVKSFGGTGEGLGELLGPMAMTWDEVGRLWVGDRQWRYSVFDSEGVIRKTVRRLPRGTRRIQLPLIPKQASRPRGGGFRLFGWLHGGLEGGMESVSRVCQRMKGDFGASLPGCLEVILTAGDTGPGGGATGRARRVAELRGVSRSRSGTPSARSFATR